MRGIRPIATEFHGDVWEFRHATGAFEPTVQPPTRVRAEIEPGRKLAGRDTLRGIAVSVGGPDRARQMPRVVVNRASDLDEPGRSFRTSESKANEDTLGGCGRRDQ